MGKLGNTLNGLRSGPVSTIRNTSAAVFGIVMYLLGLGVRIRCTWCVKNENETFYN